MRGPLARCSMGSTAASQGATPDGHRCRSLPTNVPLFAVGLCAYGGRPMLAAVLSALTLVPFGVAPPTYISDGAICGEPTGLPGELATTQSGIPGELDLAAKGGVQLWRAERGGFVAGERVALGDVMRCAKAARGPSEAGVAAVEDASGALVAAVRDPGGDWS